MYIRSIYDAIRAYISPQYFIGPSSGRLDPYQGRSTHPGSIESGGRFRAARRWRILRTGANNRRSTVTSLVVFALLSLAYEHSKAKAEAEQEGKEARPRFVSLQGGTRAVLPLEGGWSDLIISSIPRLESGDLGTLPAMASSTATLFHTVFLAELSGKLPSERIIKRIGLGLAMPVKGVDTVVTPSVANEPPFSLGFIERQVLLRAQKELEKVNRLASTPTMVVLAAPSSFHMDSFHEQVTLVYVLTLSPKTGQIATDLWSVLSDNARRIPPATYTQLPRSLVCSCGLDVKAERLFGSVPMNWSFAMNGLPPGRVTELPATLRPWSTDLRRISAKPHDFERIFRQSLGRE